MPFRGISVIFLVDWICFVLFLWVSDIFNNCKITCMKIAKLSTHFSGSSLICIMYGSFYCHLLFSHGTIFFMQRMKIYLVYFFGVVQCIVQAMFTDSSFKTFSAAEVLLSFKIFSSIFIHILALHTNGFSYSL